MRSTHSSVIALGIFAVVAIAAQACGGSNSGDAPPAPDDSTPGTPDPAGTDGGGPKAPAVGGPAMNDELTNKLGVFVATTGADNADGTREHPLARIQPAIDLAKTLGKRVYVCGGTYRESLVLADSISIIGGLDCSAGEWHTSPALSRVEAPTSPAITATEIKTATRLEGLDIVAPNATATSGSSIGLIADHSPAITVARSKITAGNAMKGADGEEGIQLSNAATTQGASIPAAFECLVGGTVCETIKNPNGTFLRWGTPSGGAGGTNICVGAPGIVAEAGGVGGSGGMYEVVSVTDVVNGQTTTFKAFQVHKEGFTSMPATLAPAGRTGAAGGDGTDGPSPAPTGTLTKDGYVPADGTNGTSGATGFGGAGGNGQRPAVDPTITAGNFDVGDLVRGWGGGGGGAGGCPGLAGTAGKGGGASIAAMLIESPITFDATQLTAAQGGDAGHGSLGSAPLPGGLRNNPAIPGTQHPELAMTVGHEGGRGGAAGVSSNGSAGPSAGIAHVGPAPKLTGDSKSVPGNGGAAIAAQTRTDALGITKTVPATPAGASKDILAL